MNWVENSKVTSILTWLLGGEYGGVATTPAWGGDRGREITRWRPAGAKSETKINQVHFSLWDDFLVNFDYENIMWFLCRSDSLCSVWNQQNESEWKQINMDKPDFPDKQVVFHSRAWSWHGVCDLGVPEQGKNSKGKQCLKGLNKYMAWICLKHIWNTWYWLLRKSPEVAGTGRWRPMRDKRYGTFRPKVTRDL